ncbi:DEAD/DEAH box helicase family protein [Mycobacterium xenopi 4042]|uniref:DEAD/DEAH box helicase family protein n=1 Tax=Mycobacterium xenopi 4042 TaxID=1299334 RepID=X7YIV1_MYCXE|nr:DEAD/DEAH box helicase family protein [Mycobacterium xenopi 4042]
MSVASLARFSAPTREWFANTFAAPTAAQSGAWSAIADGHNTLVIAPTGSGKTLAAFLWAIDRLATAAQRPAGTRVLYVSPLKALAVDVERNLRARWPVSPGSPSGKADRSRKSVWAFGPGHPARASSPAHRPAARCADHHA